MVQPENFPAPRAAYIHVPFCRHHCGYCTFTVIAGHDDLIPQFLTALERELQRLGEPQEVDTLYLGGGTPTHLAPADLDRLLRLVTHWFPRAAGHETSVEANPADVTPERVAVLAAHGVNRLSLGVQSFALQHLTTLERDHSADIIAQACARARPHIAQLSLDLIFAVPGQTLAEWESDLAAAIALEPGHLSTYGLTFEKGAAFWARRERHELVAADEELERSMYETAIDRLAAEGFEHYEVSNFARPGQRSRHNETYWLGRPYFAAGPGASRYVAGRRETNHRSTAAWLKRLLSGESPVAESEELLPADRARERAVFGLRRLAGLRRDDFVGETGFDLDALLGAPLVRYCQQGLLADDGQTIRLTRSGLCISDALWPAFLTES